MVTLKGGKASTPASTGILATTLDERQYEHGHGPCLAAAEGGEVQQIHDAASETRWPDYMPTAREAGLGSSLSVPIPIQGGMQAALNIYSTTPGSFSNDTEAAREFGCFAGVAFGNLQALDSTAQRVEHLKIAMESRAVIDKAKGVLMGTRGCTATEAFDALVAASQASNTKLRAVAEALLGRAATPGADGLPESAGVALVEPTRLMETLPAALVRLARDWTITYVNANAEAIYGRTRHELVGVNVWDAFPEARGTVIEDAYAKAMSTGDAGSLEVYFAPLDIHFDVRMWPDVHGLTLFFQDINDRKRAHQALDDALKGKDELARRLADLNAISLELTAADTVEDLERIVVGRGLDVLGSDGGALLSLSQDGDWRHAVSTVLGEQVQLVYATVPFDSSLPGPQAARTGQRVLLPTRAAGLAYAGMLSVYENIRREAWAFLPLVVGDRNLGCLAVSWADEHIVAPEELELLEGFAAQCAQTLHRAQSVRTQRETALAVKRMSETLQRSLLTQPTTTPSVQTAVRYQPAAQDAQIGGDWYDAFTTHAGFTMLVVGDVTGHDQAAAAAMSQVRNLLRGIAYDGTDSPAVLLTRLDGALHGLELQSLATAVLARLEQSPTDRVQGVWHLRWSNAGHPPPLLRHADGTVEVLENEPDLLLGLDPETSRGERLVELTEGSTLVM